MNENEKAELLAAVQRAIELDTLSLEDSLEIIRICKGAVNRKTAELTETYMINAIGGEIQ